MKLIKFIVYGVDAELVKYVKTFLEDIPSIKVLIKSVKDIPGEYFNEVRRQYRGDLINKWVYSTVGDADIIIGLFDVDAYVPPLNFVFGVANPRLRVCSVYLPRLKLGVSIRDFYIRVKKEVLHEVGHLYGLGHCINKKCVMSFSNSIHNVDLKTYKYCKKHFKELIEGGLQLPENYML